MDNEITELPKSSLLASQPRQIGGESCHAYTRTGEPRHSVPYKDKKRAGEFRPTTLRDIKERGWLPSVSSILGIMAKKGLDGWIKEQAIHGAYEEILFGVPCAHTFEDFLPRALERAESRMTRARDLGTEIHGAIEKFLSDPIAVHTGYVLRDQEPYYLHIKAAKTALEELGVWKMPFSSERTFASPLGYGGTVDFKVDGLIADFKGVDSLTKKLAYPDRCAQLTGYSAGQIPLEEINKSRRFGDSLTDLVIETRLANIFISTSEPGKYLIHEWSTEDKEKAWKIFTCSYELWVAVNSYDPRTLAPLPSE